MEPFMIDKRISMIKTTGYFLRWAVTSPHYIKTSAVSVLFISCAGRRGSPEQGYCICGHHLWPCWSFHVDCTILACPHRLETSLSNWVIPDLKPTAMCAALNDSLMLLTSARTGINESQELELRDRRQRGKKLHWCRYIWRTQHVPVSLRSSIFCLW